MLHRNKVKWMQTICPSNSYIPAELTPDFWDFLDFREISQLLLHELSVNVDAE